MKKNLTLLVFGVIIALVAVAGLLTGCGSTHVESPYQHDIDSLGLSSNILRYRNTDRILRIGLIIESASDSIILLSNDAAIRHRARVWRSYAMPGIRQALSFSDPAAATLDGWAFAVQHRDYLTNGKGRSLFGPQQEIAIRAARKIEELFSGDRPFEEGSESIQEKIEGWAATHTIDNNYYMRPSLVPSLKALNLDVTDESLTGSVGLIANDVRDISNRLSLYATQLPREARWQAEELLGDMNFNTRLDSLDAQARVLVSAVDHLTSTVNAGDLVVDVHGLQQLRADIIALKQQISTERELLLADVNRQRLETLREMERMSRELLLEFRTPAKVLVDYVLFRAMIAMVIIILVTVAIVFWVRRRAT